MSDTYTQLFLDLRHEPEAAVTNALLPVFICLSQDTLCGIKDPASAYLSSKRHQPAETPDILGCKQATNHFCGNMPLAFSDEDTARKMNEGFAGPSAGLNTTVVKDQRVEPDSGDSAAHMYKLVCHNNSK